MKILVAAAVAAFAASAAVPSHAAPRKCTPQMVYADWYDGQLETAWPIACLRAALRNAPDDVVTYGDLPQDLQLALARAIRAKRQNDRPRAGGSPRGGGTGGQSAPSSGGGTSSSGTSGPASSGSRSGPETPTSLPRIEERPRPAAERRLASDPNKQENLFEKAANKLGPGTAESVPLPLILLAGLALILLATAAASVVARRVQARRVRVVDAGPATPPERPLEP